jgi:hypothetical protein
VVRGGRMDEEQRYRDLAHANEKKGAVMLERVSESN